MGSLKTRSLAWKVYLNSNQPENEIIPYEALLSPFQKLLVLSVFHIHRVHEALRLFISETLGNEFNTPPSLNLMKFFKESLPTTPHIFIFTSAINPQDEILGIGAVIEMEKYLKSYSLGQGRGSGAEELIVEAAERDLQSY